jgi:hypothetical protein
MLAPTGELGDEAQQRNGIVGAAVCCVPFHPADTEPLLASGVGKSVYSANFLRSLREKATRQVWSPGQVDSYPLCLLLSRKSSKNLPFRCFHEHPKRACIRSLRIINRCFSLELLILRFSFLG